MIPYGIKELQSGFWSPLQVMSCMFRALVYCMYVYNVQFSQLFHTSLVFVSECNTQSHTAVWSPVSPGGSTTTVWRGFQRVFLMLLCNSKKCQSVTSECAKEFVLGKF